MTPIIVSASVAAIAVIAWAVGYIMGYNRGYDEETL